MRHSQGEQGGAAQPRGAKSRASRGGRSRSPSPTNSSYRYQPNCPVPRGHLSDSRFTRASSPGRGAKNGTDCAFAPPYPRGAKRVRRSQGERNPALRAAGGRGRPPLQTVVTGINQITLSRAATSQTRLSREPAPLEGERKRVPSSRDLPPLRRRRFAPSPAPLIQGEQKGCGTAKGSKRGAAQARGAKVVRRKQGKQGKQGGDNRAAAATRLKTQLTIKTKHTQQAQHATHAAHGLMLRSETDYINVC